MKKIVLVLGLLVISISVVWVQFSVIMYGIVDVGLCYFSNVNFGGVKKFMFNSGML